MNQQELLLLIAKYFSRFKEQVDILNANGEFSINIHAENVLIKILNTVYDLDLENVNYEEGKTYDSIDLRDRAGNCSFQITATRTVTKVKNTLEKYIANGHYKNSKELKILIITGRQEKYSQQAIDKVLDGVIDFDVNTGILDFTNLYLELNKQNDLQKIFTVKNLLEEQFTDGLVIQKLDEIKSLKDLCIAISPYLKENESIFKNFGPNSGATNTAPLRWDLTLWYDARREKILPNNRVISNLLTAYQNLIPDEFQEVINMFQAHAYAFEKHCENPYFDYSEYQFPKQFPQLIFDAAK
jgi:hypothetical protein